MKKITIAIDGTAGSGKGTLAKAIAEILGYNYLDTGAIYRTLAYNFKDEDILKLQKSDFKDLQISFDEKNDVCLNDKNVEAQIRTNEMGTKASNISTIPFVREFVTKISQDIIGEGGFILEGRDTTTVVAPDAQLKIYVDADIKIRAKRRFDQLKESGKSSVLEELEKSIYARDEQDKNKAVGPLKIAEGAFVIDNSNLSIEEQIKMILERAIEKMN